MKREDFYVGQKLVVKTTAHGMGAKVGDVVVVSALANDYVYVEGNHSDSGNGISYGRFEPYVEPVVTKFEDIINEYDIVLKSGKCVTTFHGSLTNEQILAVMNILKKGK